LIEKPSRVVPAFSQARRTHWPLAGFIANGRTGALIDHRGRVGWLAFPTFAHFPVFASLLDPAHGGYLKLGLRLGDTVFWPSSYGFFAQRYLPDTTILQTTWIVAGHTVTILDWMPRGWTLLVREITVSPCEGQPAILVRLCPTAPTPSSVTFVVRQDGIQMRDRRVSGQGSLRLRSTGIAMAQSRTEAGCLLKRFDLPPADGRHCLSLLLSYEPEQGASIPFPAPGRGAHEGEEKRWLGKGVQIKLPDEMLTAALRRSLLTLRGLIYELIGAILAAATASFPSEPGGSHNWDYRNNVALTSAGANGC